MNTISRIALGVCAVLLAMNAWAQSPRAASVNVNFKFVAGEKEFPPGRYQFSQPSHEAQSVSLRSIGDNSSVQLKVHTLMAREGTLGGDKVRLVFDKVGDRRILSEVWLPGHDGLLVHGTEGDHKHEVLR